AVSTGTGQRSCTGRYRQDQRLSGVARRCHDDVEPGVALWCGRGQGWSRVLGRPAGARACRRAPLSGRGAWWPAPCAPRATALRLSCDRSPPGLRPGSVQDQEGSMASTDQRAQPAAPPPAPTPAEAGAPLDLRGRTAVVTGAASGIGRACALRLAAAGAEVRLVDRDAEGVRALADGGAGTAVVADLADPEAAEEIGRGADIVLNNAGFQLVCPVEEFPPEEFSRMLRVMVEAPFRTVRAALPHMYRQRW